MGVAAANDGQGHLGSVVKLGSALPDIVADVNADGGRKSFGHGDFFDVVFGLLDEKGSVLFQHRQHHAKVIAAQITGHPVIILGKLL